MGTGSLFYTGQKKYTHLQKCTDHRITFLYRTEKIHTSAKMYRPPDHFFIQDRKNTHICKNVPTTRSLLYTGQKKYTHLQKCTYHPITFLYRTEKIHTSAKMYPPPDHFFIQDRKNTHICKNVSTTRSLFYTGQKKYTHLQKCTYHPFIELNSKFFSKNFF